MLKKFMLALAAFWLKKNDFMPQAVVDAVSIPPAQSFSPAEDEESSSARMQAGSNFASESNKWTPWLPAALALDANPTALNQCPSGLYPNFFMVRTPTHVAGEEEKVSDTLSQADAQPASSKARSFCVTGMVLVDGTGDVDHILNGGRHLEKRNPGDHFVYHIQWRPTKKTGEQHQEYSQNETRRLTILVEKLLYHKLISGNKEDYLCDDPKAMINKINKNANGKVVIHYTDGIKKESILNLKVDGWIVFSTRPQLCSQSDNCMSPEFLPGDKVIAFLEHKSARYNNAPGTVDMGFENQKNGEKAVGIFLEDTSSSSEATRARYLSEIKSTHFHTLLHGEDTTDEAHAAEYVKNTIFVPWYIEPKEIGPKLLINAYEGMLGAQDDRDVFVRGKMPIPDSENQARLAQLGFSEIRYLDKAGNISEIALPGALGKKKLILSDAYMEEVAYRLFDELATVFAGCAGDNSVQQAISKGIVPVTAPKSQEKAKFMKGLYDMLEGAEKAGKIKIPLVMNFLYLYVELEPYYQEVASITETKAVADKLATTQKNSAGEDVYSPGLLEEWKTVCVYLKENYNAYASLSRFVDTYKQQLDLKEAGLLEEESPALLIQKDIENLAAQMATQKDPMIITMMSKMMGDFKQKLALAKAQEKSLLEPQKDIEKLAAQMPTQENPHIKMMISTMMGRGL